MRKSRKLRFTDHALERMAERGIKKNMVDYCYRYGTMSGRRKNTVFLYQYEDLVVVLGKNNVEVVTVYWKQEEDLSGTLN
jgi:hypothetical protein